MKSDKKRRNIPEWAPPDAKHVLSFGEYVNLQMRLLRKNFRRLIHRRLTVLLSKQVQCPRINSQDEMTGLVCFPGEYKDSKWSCKLT